MNAPPHVQSVLHRARLDGIDALDIPIRMFEPCPEDLLDTGGAVRLPDSIWRHRTKVDIGMQKVTHAEEISGENSVHEPIGGTHPHGGHGSSVAPFETTVKRPSRVSSVGSADATDV